MSINAISQANRNIAFKSTADKKSQYENPVSRSTEKNLAILTGVGGSVVVGAIATGLSTFVVPAKDVAKGGFFAKNKIAVGIGAAAALVSLAFTLPAKLYNTKVNVYVKEKEMDVFSRDRSLKTNLTEEVDKEVKNSEISLDKKLDDNLKLQMANKGAAIGIANVTPNA